MENIQALEKIGLNNKESRIYLKLLEKGTLTANEISKLTGILRQTAYEVLENLKQKGLIFSFIKNKKNNFEASDPHKLKETIEEKQQIISSLIPELQKIRGKINIKTKVEFYEGVEGIKNVYNQILKDKPKEMLEYGNSTLFIEIMKFYFIDNYIIKRVKNNTNVKLITEKNEKIKEMYKSDKKMLRETRYIGNINKIKTAGYIYNNNLIIIKFSPEPLAILIKDEEIIKTQREFFNLLWNISKE